MSSLLWPLRPQPLPGEILSSWISRLAAAYGMELEAFRGEMLPKTPPDAEIDRAEDPEVFQFLADRTGLDYEVIWQMTLSADEGSIYARNSNKKPDWITPRTVFHSGRRQSVLPHCAACLAEDEFPYYRKAWRYAFLPICPKHGLLRDQCSACGHPYCYIRTNELGLTFGTGTLDKCRKCGEAITQGNSETDALVPRDIFEKALSVQDRLLKALAERFVEVDGYGQVHVCMYFAGLHKMASLLKHPTRRRQMWKFIGDQAGWTASNEFPLEQIVTEMGRDKTVESVTPWTKCWLLAAIDWLTNAWPERYIAMLDECPIQRYVRFVETSGYLPYWLVSGKLSVNSKAASRVHEQPAAKALLFRRRSGTADYNSLLRFMRTGIADRIQYVRPPYVQWERIDPADTVIAETGEVDPLNQYAYDLLEVDRDFSGLRDSIRCSGDDLERFGELVELIKRNEREID